MFNCFTFMVPAFTKGYSFSDQYIYTLSSCKSAWFIFIEVSIAYHSIRVKMAGIYNTPNAIVLSVD